VKERPILFSAPMVRAILEGRKTQTRRVLKHQPIRCNEFPVLLFPQSKDEAIEQTGYIWPNAKDQIVALCPYGQPGDRLWVRETWQGPLMDADTMETEYRASPDEFHNPKYCVYAADGGPAPEFVTLDDELVCRWRPSIHMPRWASRILLEVVSVRVERLQDISEADAKAEGSDCLITANCTDRSRALLDLPLMEDRTPYRNGYALLWESINGDGSWEANPWVWCISFRRIDASQPLHASHRRG
jgi:hypothetical protein